MDSGPNLDDGSTPTPPPPSSGPGSDMAPDPIGPNTRSFLYNTISPGESGGRYDIRFGGANGPGFFSGYDQHPNVRSDIPGTGLTSDAAGRYQFLSSTWKPIAAKLGLKDFSPQSQDIGAAYLASTTYKSATGRDLETDLADPSKRPSILAALTPQWPSLGKGGGGGGGGGTMVAQAPQAPQPQPQQPDYLKQMYALLANSLAMQGRHHRDPASDRLAMMQSIMPQQQQAQYTGAGSQFPWVQAILGHPPANALQTYANAIKMRSYQDDSSLS